MAYIEKEYQNNKFIPAIFSFRLMASSSIRMERIQNPSKFILTAQTALTPGKVYDDPSLNFISC